MKIKLILMTILFGSFAFSQDVKQSLLISHAEVAQDARAQFKQKIYAYHFVNGAYTGREEIMSFDGKKNGKDYVRTDNGKNILYNERFLITGIGKVIDIVDKKILFDGKANLVRISNDSAIYYTNDAFKGKYYSVFNFKTKKYSETKNLLFKARYDQDIEFDKTSKPFKVNFYPQGKPKLVLVQNAGYGQQKIMDSKYIPDPPVYWLDEKNFIYVNFNQAGDAFNIHSVNLEKASSKDLGKINLTAGTRQAFFEVISANFLILHLGARQVYLNLKEETLTVPAFTKPEFDFSYSLEEHPQGRSINYLGKEIGKFSFDVELFAASKNIVATVKVLSVGDEMYQQGLQVWDKTSKKWQKIDSEDVLAILGWVSN
jgi:hypothetical protein